MHLIRSCGRPERNLDVDTTSVLLVSRFFVCNGSVSNIWMEPNFAGDPCFIVRAATNLSSRAAIRICE